MKKLLFFLLLAASSLFAQSYRFAWLTDVHIGYPEADTELDSVVQLVNSFDDIEFTIISGDIGEKGMNDQLQTAKSIFDKLEKPYYIVPGNHDTKWSESGCTKFSELFGDNKFIFEYNNDVFVGLNSGIPWRGGGGHLTPEDLKWLKTQLTKFDSSYEVYYVQHHPLTDETDNWYKLTNILRENNIKAMFHGHGHNNTIESYNGLPGIMARSTLSQRRDSWGFTMVENGTDSIKFFEVKRDTIPLRWGGIAKTQKPSIPYVDSIATKEYSSEIVWSKTLNKTLSVPPLTTEDKVIITERTGKLTCFDSEGEEKWSYDMPANIMSKPTFSNGMVFVADTKGNLKILNGDSGKEINSITLGTTITSRLITYRANNSRFLLAGTSEGNLYSLGIPSLKVNWVNDSAKGMIETEPLLLKGKIIYGSWDSYIYCLNSESGEMIWKTTPRDNFYYSPASCKPVTDGEKVYISTPEKILFAYNADSGELVWKKKDYRSWESLGVSADKKRILSKSVSDSFSIISAESGDLIKTIDMKLGFDTMPIEPIEWDGNIIFGSKKGIIYRIDENYDFSPVLFMGTARIYSICHIKDNFFFAANMDGNLVMFKIK